jgi:alkanesulfonate monooxygenase
MPVEFLGIAATRDGFETPLRSGAAFGKDRTLRLVRALRPPTAAATGGAGNSNALAGAPKTVAQALPDCCDLGVGILSARGCDPLGDAIDFGRYVIPIVREEVARRGAERAARGTRNPTAVNG